MYEPWLCVDQPVEMQEEELDEEGDADHDDQKAAKGDDNWALLSHMREGDVGITEYISLHKGISAIIKQR